MKTKTTNATPTAPAADLAAALDRDGYGRGCPWLHADAAAIDREAAAGADCPACGKKGMAYSAWHHGGARSYVAVATCGACQASFEF